RIEKGSLYARAGIADYWIVNLVDRVVEVYREPGADVTAPYGWRYISVERFTPPSSVAPFGVPTAPIPIPALLPSPPHGRDALPSGIRWPVYPTLGVDAPAPGARSMTAWRRTSR